MVKKIKINLIHKITSDNVNLQLLSWPTSKDIRIFPYLSIFVLIYTKFYILLQSK